MKVTFTASPAEFKSNGTVIVLVMRTLERHEFDCANLAEVKAAIVTFHDVVKATGKPCAFSFWQSHGDRSRKVAGFKTLKNTHYVNCEAADAS